MEYTFFFSSPGDSCCRGYFGIGSIRGIPQYVLGVNRKSSPCFFLSISIRSYLGVLGVPPTVPRLPTDDFECSVVLISLLLTRS
jgi:hypothetical protein